MTTRELPQTRNGQIYRKILGAVFVLSIAIITTTLKRVVSDLMDVEFELFRLDAKMTIGNALLLIGGGLLSWMSYRGNRRNLWVPEWAIVTIVAILWALVLVNRFA